MTEQKEPISLSLGVLTIYLVLLPISAGLAGWIGSASIQNYIAVLYCVIALIGIIVSKRMLFLNSIWLYAFWIYSILSMIWTPAFSFSWYYTTFLLNMAIFFIALQSEYGNRDRKVIETAVLLGMIPVILATLFNLESVIKYRLIIKIFSEMDPNDFGCGLLLIVALCFSKLITGKTKWTVPILVTCAVIIVLTGSRGAMITFIAIAITWMLMSNMRKSFLIPLLVILLFFVLFIAFYDYIPEYLSDRLNFGKLLEDGGSGRLKIWKAALNSFLQASPIQMIFGAGYGSFKTTVHYIAVGHFDTYQSHNIWVNTLIENGALGLLLLVMLFVNSFVISARRKNYWGILSLVGLAVAGCTLDMQVYRIFPIVFFIAISLKGEQRDEPVAEEQQK